MRLTTSRPRLHFILRDFSAQEAAFGSTAAANSSTNSPTLPAATKPKAGQEVLDEFVLRSRNVVGTQALGSATSGALNYVPQHEGFDAAANDTATHQPRIYSPLPVGHFSEQNTDQPWSANRSRRRYQRNQKSGEIIRR